MSSPRKQSFQEWEDLILAAKKDFAREKLKQAGTMFGGITQTVRAKENQQKLGILNSLMGNMYPEVREAGILSAVADYMQKNKLKSIDDLVVVLAEPKNSSKHTWIRGIICATAKFNEIQPWSDHGLRKISGAAKNAGLLQDVAKDQKHEAGKSKPPSPK